MGGCCEQFARTVVVGGPTPTTTNLPRVEREPCTYPTDSSTRRPRSRPAPSPWWPIGVSLRKARAELDDRTAPLAGLVAAFIFATQMLNFPVAGGTSGHLMGGAIAAVLVGPWTGVLATSVVFIVQCLLFADGGITALGTNIVLMGVTTVAVGWVVFRGRAGRAAQDASRWSRSRPASARSSACRSPRSSSSASTRVGGAADIPLGSAHRRHGRRPRAHRHRRGRHHLPRGRQHHRRPPRPRARRALGAGRRARSRSARPESPHEAAPSTRVGGRRDPRSSRCSSPASSASTPPAAPTA